MSPPWRETGEVGIDGLTGGLSPLFPVPRACGALTKAVFHAVSPNSMSLPIAQRGPPVRDTLTPRGDRSSDSQLPGLVTRTITHTANCRFELSHSPPGSSPRVYIFIGLDKMSALFGKCLSLGDFVLRKTPVPINDPVCILKSPEAAFWKAWVNNRLSPKHTPCLEHCTTNLLTGADKSLRWWGSSPKCLENTQPWRICHPMDDSIRPVGETFWKVVSGFQVAPSTSWGHLRGKKRRTRIIRALMAVRALGHAGRTTRTCTHRAASRAGLPGSFGLGRAAHGFCLLGSAVADHRRRAFGPDLGTGLHNRKPERGFAAVLLRSLADKAEG